MKRASEYRRLARFSMGGQLGTMAASGFMQILIYNLVGVIVAVLAAIGLIGIVALTVGWATSLGGAGIISIFLVIMISVLGIAASAFIWLLKMGIVYQAGKAVYGQNVSISDMFAVFKISRAWKLMVIGLMHMAIMLFFWIPYAVVLVITEPFTSVAATIALTLSYLWLLVGNLVVFLLFGLSYYISLDQPQLGPVQCMKENLVLTRKCKWKLLCLLFSFTGWYILVALTMGIGALWVQPYLYCTMYHFYEDLKIRKSALGIR